MIIVTDILCSCSGGFHPLFLLFVIPPAFEFAPSAAFRRQLSAPLEAVAKCQLLKVKVTKIFMIV
jgi:hypothetical protein